MASDNLTLNTFVGQVYAVQFVNNTPREGHLARKQVVKIVEHMWELLEASKRALTRAMRENAVHTECMGIALDCLTASVRYLPTSEPVVQAISKIQAKLAELEKP